MPATPSPSFLRGSSSEKVCVEMTKRPYSCGSSLFKSVDDSIDSSPPCPKSTGRASTTSGPTARTTTITTTSREDYTDSGTKSAFNAGDCTPNYPPRGGEKPNELLQRLYNLWPTQLTASYRPNAVGNPEATADFNLRYIRELYPRRRGLRRKAKAAAFILTGMGHTYICFITFYSPQIAESNQPHTHQTQEIRNY
ncbi:hypothetical protein ACOMHN_057305 [Nucella lapillus]